VLLFHEEKKLKARVRLTSHNILEIANPPRIHRCLKWTSLTPGSIRESADRAQTASEIHRMPSPGLKGVTCYGPSTNSSMACAKPSSSFL
jgi:hypothetical protein